METFGDRILLSRTRLGLSQAQLARLCGLSQSAISGYENGSRRSSKKLTVIAQILGVSFYWLMHGEGDQSPAQPEDAMREATQPWPFPSIEPRLFWALKAKDRDAIESAVAVLIEKLQS
ncbi:helix-turn-helix domain-containing protein [Castellaniella hirudinis]|uniref:helix-turn-helix domain-containing protein n=1 Tax=Castellaniella hirudinis TaxID=1144617 RepID=UPI0039C13731